MNFTPVHTAEDWEYANSLDDLVFPLRAGALGDAVVSKPYVGTRPRSVPRPTSPQTRTQSVATFWLSLEWRTQPYYKFRGTGDAMRRLVIERRSGRSAFLAMQEIDIIDPKSAARDAVDKLREHFEELRKQNH